MSSESTQERKLPSEWELTSECRNLLEALRQLSGISEKEVGEWSALDGISYARRLKKTNLAAKRMKQYVVDAHRIYGEKFDLGRAKPRELTPRAVAVARKYIEDDDTVNFILNEDDNLLHKVFARHPTQSDVENFVNAAALMQTYYEDRARKMELVHDASSGLPRILDAYDEAASEKIKNAVEGPKHYTTPVQADGTIYLGDLLLDTDPEAAAFLGRSLWFDKENAVLKQPFAYDVTRPFVLFIECACTEEDETVARERAGSLVRSILYQATQDLPLYGYQFIYFDPSRGGKSLRDFSTLNKAKTRSAYQLEKTLFPAGEEFTLLELAGTQEAANTMMKHLDEDVASTIRICGGYRDIFEYNEGKRQDAVEANCEPVKLIPRRFVVYENTDRTLIPAHLEVLRKAIENAGKCGISLILTACKTKEKIRQEEQALEERRAKGKDASRIQRQEWEKLKSLCTDQIFWCDKTEESAPIIQIGEHRRYDTEQEPERKAYLFQPQPLGQADLRNYMGEIVQAFHPTINTETLFEKRIEVENNWGHKYAETGIEVTLGVNARGKLLGVTLGSDAQPFAMLAGSSGCGKSNLLHSIINEIIVNYTPDDVQIWLADYKSIEFLSYAENTPPHIKYIAADRRKEHTFKFIDRMEEECSRRQKLFSASLCKSLTDYRNKFGKKSMPRLLIIIDEFHCVSNHIKEEPVYKEKLESLLRVMRAVGMTTLFADQTFSTGLPGLTDSAKKQITLRMAMKADAEEYNAIFDIRSARSIPELMEMEAFQVTVRYLLHEKGEDGSEVTTPYYEKCNTLHLTSKTQAEVATQSIKKYGSCEDVVVVRQPDRFRADWDSVMAEKASLPQTDAARLYCGETAETGKGSKYFSVVLENNASENVLCVGKDEKIHASLLQSFLTSIDKSGAKDKIYILADASAGVGKLCLPQLRVCQAENERLRCVTDMEEICSIVGDLKQENDRRHSGGGQELSIFVFWLGLENLAADMSNYPADKPEPGTGKMLYDATQDIAELISHGPENGIHHFVFGSSMKPLDAVSCGSGNDFTHKLLFKMEKEENTELAKLTSPLREAGNKSIDEKLAFYHDGTVSRQFFPFLGSIEEGSLIPAESINQADLAEAKANEAFRAKKEAWLRDAGGLPQILQNYDEAAEQKIRNIEIPPHYTAPTQAGGSIYLGDLLLDTAPEAREALEKSCWFDRSNAVLRQPFAYDAAQPFTLFIECAGQSEAAARERTGSLVRSILYQVTRTLPLYDYQFLYFDPSRGGSSLSDFLTLGEAKTKNAYQLEKTLFPEDKGFSLLELAGTQETANAMISELNKDVAATIRICGGYQDVFEYNEAKRRAADKANCEVVKLIPRRFVIYENVDRTLNPAQLQVLRMAIENAEKCGISLIFTAYTVEEKTRQGEQTNRKVADQTQGEEWKTLKSLCKDQIFWCAAVREAVPVIRIGKYGQNNEGTKSKSYRFLPQPCGQESLKNYLSEVVQEFHPKINAETLFEKRIDVENSWGKKYAETGIDVTLGVNARGELRGVTLGSDGQPFAMLAGTSGCGKSTFLNAIINEIVVNYTPDDVQIWLADYKSIEFLSYAVNTPPHIKYVAADKSKEHTIKFLDKMEAEYKRRLMLFTENPRKVYRSLSEYRESNGRKSLPRLLIIIDEFHNVSNHIKEEPEYKQKLESLLREMRAVGMTTLFADQTFSTGLPGLTDSAKNQITLRMAMKANVEEYNAIFDIRDAREIPEMMGLDKHQVTIRYLLHEKDEYGAEITTPYYEKCNTLHLTPERQEEIAKRSIEKYGSCKDLIVVRPPDRVLANWDNILADRATLPKENGVRLFGGGAIGGGQYFSFDLKSNFRENVMCIGGNEKMQASLLQSFLASIKNSGVDYEVYVLADSSTELAELCRQQLLVNQAMDDSFHYVANEEEICSVIRELAQEGEQRRRSGKKSPQVLTFWLGLENLAMNMDYYRSKPEPQAEEMLYDAREDIAHLTKQGPKYNLHNFVFYQSTAPLRDVRCARTEDFTHKILFKMGDEESADFTGKTRLLRDAEDKPIDEKTAVYYDGTSKQIFLPFRDSIEEGTPISEELILKAQQTEERVNETFRAKKEAWIQSELLSENNPIGEQAQRNSKTEDSLGTLLDSDEDDAEALANQWFAESMRRLAEEESSPQKEDELPDTEKSFGGISESESDQAEQSPAFTPKSEAQEEPSVEPTPPEKPFKSWYLWDTAERRQLLVTNYTGLDFGWDEQNRIWVPLTAQMMFFEKTTQTWEPVPTDSGGKLLLE